jgi:hypothetical protein
MISTAALLMTFLPLAQSGLVVFQGAPGGVGAVVEVDPSATSPAAPVAGLDNLTLLPLDATGRLELSGLRSDAPRFRDDIPGASRLVLPSGRGSLYRYSRPASIGLEFGLFVVDGAGRARRVFARQGVGATADQPPFVARVAVAPSGDSVLVITTLPAGGDVIEVDLASGAELNRTANVAPQRFVAGGVHYRASWGVLASPAGVWRFAVGSPGDASPIVFPAPAPARFSGEVAFSSNDAWAVTTAGPAADELDVYAFGPAGNAVAVTAAPARLSPAGYLPDHLHGPYLAISDDGSRCAWRLETDVSREAFLGRVPQLAPAPADHLTQDLNFIDTIDEIGDFFFRPASNVLVFAAGERSTTGPPVIENIDLYSAQLPAGGAANLLNVTLSSGDPLPPFTQPAELKPQTTALEPGTSRVLMHTRSSGGTGQMIAIDASSTGFTVLIPHAKEVQFIERAGADTLLALQRANGAKPVEVFRIDANWTPPSAPLLSVNELHWFDRFTAGPGGWAAFVERTLTKERLWRFDPSSSALVKFSERALFFGPTLAWAPTGELGLSVGQGGVVSLFGAWPRTSSVLRLPLPPGPGFFLPGA